jgi:hypothetical protein
MSRTLAERAARALAPRMGRRGFLARTAMAGTALTAAPATYVLRPRSAYAAICNCSGSRCDCGSLCCDGYTEFCCTVTGMNRCPPGTLTGGWWKVDSSGYCGGGPRYYIDCNHQCGSCGCGGSGICSGSCSGARCSCARGSCGNRKWGCTGFRYGQCNQHVRCLGPIACRVVTCVPPWQRDPTCTTAVRVDNATRNHHRPCLTGSPFGSLDSVTAVAGGVRVRGWSIDPNTVVPTRVHIYIDGRGRDSIAADRPRTDVARVYTGAGTLHGFDHEVKNVAPGQRRVCVYAIDRGGEGGNTLLGCRTVTVSANPFGRVDKMAIEYGMLRLRGWAIDTNTNDPIRIHVYANGKGIASLGADRNRPDIGARYGRGSNHGFDAAIRIPPGVSNVTVFAINKGAGSHTVIGQGRVSWNGSPVGHLDRVEAVGGGRVRIRGWAMDAETPNPIRVHLYGNGRGLQSVAADRERSDLARLGNGTAHGFDTTVTVGAGTHNICAYAINVGVAGGNVLLGCKQVTVT